MKEIWRKWSKIAERIGNFQATIIFSLLYFLLVTPIGLISGIFTDYLYSKSKNSWKETEKSLENLADLKKQ